MIGTNNAGDTPHQTPEQIGEGVKAIIDKLPPSCRADQSVAVGDLSRRTDNNDPIRKIDMKANAIISTLADNKNVFYLDIGPKFLQVDGTLSTDVMPDLLHPNAKGFVIWAEAIELMVAKLMGDHVSASWPQPRDDDYS